MKNIKQVLLNAVCAILFLGIGQAQAKSPLDGSIKVVNQRGAPVYVSIDSERVGTVAPRTSKRFDNIPNGRRIVSFKSRRSRAETRPIDVPISGNVSFTINRRTRQVTLTNPNPEDMWLSVNGKRQRMIRAQRSTSMKMSFGKHTLAIRPVGSSSSKPIMRQIHVRRSSNVMIQLPRYFAALTISSDHFGGAKIFVDGKRRGRLHRNGNVTLTAIEPGAHRIELKKHRSTVASIQLQFAAGQSHHWSPRPQGMAKLKVVNPRDRALQFRINGRRPVTVAAYGYTFVRNLPFGEHEITWRGPRGRERSQSIFVNEANDSVTIASFGRGTGRGGFARRR